SGQSSSLLSMASVAVTVTAGADRGAGPSGRSRDLGSACLVHVVGRDGTQLCEGAREVCARAAQVGGIVGGVGLLDRLVEACHHGVDRVQGVDEAAQRVVQGPGGDVRVGGGVGEIVRQVD